MPATPIINQCNGIFTDQSIFRFFPRNRPVLGLGKDKRMRPHVNMSLPCRHVSISPCLWLQLVAEVPVGVWIRNKFKLNINRSVKTPWQEYVVVPGSWWWVIDPCWSSPSSAILVSLWFIISLLFLYLNWPLFPCTWQVTRNYLTDLLYLFMLQFFLCPQEASMYPLRMRLLLHQQQLESMRQQHQVLINKHQNSVESAATR